MSHNDLYDHAKWILLEADMMRKTLEGFTIKDDTPLLVDRLKHALELVRHVKGQIDLLSLGEASQEGGSPS